MCGELKYQPVVYTLWNHSSQYLITVKFQKENKEFG